MIPIIFLAGSARLRSSADALLSGFTFSRQTHNSMGTFNITMKKNVIKNDQKMYSKVYKSNLNKVTRNFYYMKSPKLPVGPVGKIRLLGGAAPLSS